MDVESQVSSGDRQILPAIDSVRQNPKIATSQRRCWMGGWAMAITSLNVSLPGGLKDYVKERVAAGNYITLGGFAHDKICKDMQRRRREKLEQMLPSRAASGETEDVNRTIGPSWARRQQSLYILDSRIIRDLC